MRNERIALVMMLALTSLGALACAEGGPAPSATEGEGEGEGEGAPACTAMVAGGWNASGAAFGMAMATTAALTECTVAFSDWTMPMSTPTGATLAGDVVTFSGAGWTDCTGTLASDGRSIAGQCSDGSALSMAAQ